MLTFLHQNLVSVIGWLVTIIITPIIAALLYPVVAERIRRRADSRVQHLSELKQDLLSPMLDYLRGHMLPILERKLGNVGVEPRVIKNSSPQLIPEPEIYTDAFCFLEAAEPPIDIIRYPEVPTQEDAQVEPPRTGPLYADAKQSHFPLLFSDWEHLLSAFDRYNLACIEYVEKLRAQIAQSAPLPDYHTGLASLPGSPVIHSTRIALVIFYQQLGIPTGQFHLKTEGNVVNLVYSVAQYLVQGSPNDVNQLVARLDQLVQQRSDIEKILAEANRIKTEALNIQRKIEDVLLTRRLPGRCRFLA